MVTWQKWRLPSPAVAVEVFSSITTSFTTETVDADRRFAREFRMLCQASQPRQAGLA
jgi:hypothetical protein